MHGIILLIIIQCTMGCRLCKNYRNFELNILKIFTYIHQYLYISADIYYNNYIHGYLLYIHGYLYTSADIYYIPMDIYYISGDIYIYPQIFIIYPWIFIKYLLMIVVTWDQLTIVIVTKNEIKPFMQEYV